jgi:pilus assembly protein Flp/PilA
MWNDLKGYVQRCHARMLTFELKREEGQAMVEYGLILALVSIIGIVALTAIGTNVNGVFEKVKVALEGA